MCAIVGKLYFDRHRPVSETLVRSMAQCLAHRGPDDEGVYCAENVGLGHRRLSIIDLSPAGHQPMSNEDGTVWIVFNGEIYNFQKLRASLQGHAFRSHSDTEVIIRLYEQYGENCLQHLRGMFAFAIWDAKKQKLFLARDRVGKKPLKYYIGKDFFCFASELKALLKDPDVPRELDREAVFHYLTFQYVPHPMTGFKGIAKLPPAHYLVVDLSRTTPNITMKRYWDLDYSKKLRLSEEEWKHRIIDKLEESVKLRMISDVPLGAFLSGGVDSSAIVALMARNSSQPIKTFSIGFAEQAFNELPYARIIAERYRTDHQEFTVKPDAIEVLPKLTFHYEEPYADSSALPTYYLSQMTRKYVTVALNGDGGDENFAGYPWYAILNYAARYRMIPGFVRHAAARLAIMLLGGVQDFHVRYGLIFADGAASADPAVLHSELLSYFNKREKAALLGTHPVSVSASSAQRLERYYEASKAGNPVDAALYVDIHTYLADDLLAKVDIASMAVGLEARSPLLDHEFMELAAQIPPSLKLRNGSGKYVFKKALESLVPATLLYRKKTGFSVPLNRWFQTSLKDYAHDLLLDQNAGIRAVLSHEEVARLLRAHVRNGGEGKKIWLLLTLELWLRGFFKELRKGRSV